MAEHSVNKAYRETARLLGATESQFSNDTKLNENWEELLNEANDLVCADLGIPERSATIATTNTAIAWPASAREDAEVTVKWRDPNYARDVVIPVYDRNQADAAYSDWERWVVGDGDPQFILHDRDNLAAGLIPYPQQATATWILRYQKRPASLPPKSSTSLVLDGEFKSFHDLVPMRIAMLILDRDYFGGEAGTPEQLGGNARKLQRLEGMYRARLGQALKAKYSGGIPVRNPWRR